ncbi:MAG: hypothetical protein Fur007_08470 [Rhodoferax sp.]
MPQGRVLRVGQDVLFGEQIKTDAKGAVHLLFSDQSSLTLGPNSSLVIDRYSYQPDKNQGDLAVSLSRGLLRVVGGAVSKLGETRVTTQNGTLGIRGGIALVEAREDGTRGTFVFGERLLATSSAGQQQTVLRPGFFVELADGRVSEPRRVPPEDFVALLGRLESAQTERAADDAVLARGQRVNLSAQRIVRTVPLPAIDPDRLERVVRDVNQRDPEVLFDDLLGTDKVVYQS